MYCHDRGPEARPCRALRFIPNALRSIAPPRWRIGGLPYLEARETFLSSEHRATLEAARERTCRALAAEARPQDEVRVDELTSPPRAQWMLFPTDPEP